MSKQTIPVERRRPRSLQLAHCLTIERPRAAVYHFLTHRLPLRYRELSPAHERFAVEGGGPVGPGSVIDCRERAKNQEVHHRYVVEAYQQDRHLYYASRPSRTFIHLSTHVIPGESDTHVYYDLTDVGPHTELCFNLIIELPHLAQKLLARATGSLGLWRGHVVEELSALKSILEAEVAEPDELGQCSLPLPSRVVC